MALYSKGCEGVINFMGALCGFFGDVKKTLGSWRFYRRHSDEREIEGEV